MRDELPGDELLPGAGIVFDTSRSIAAPPQAIWPWLVQLGRARAGWYLPARLERLLPRRRRALRTIDERWQALAVGDEVPDYGGVDDTLVVARIDAPSVLVYTSQRGQARFTWALVLVPLPGGRTRVRLRFRAALRSRGPKRGAIVALGHVFDRATGELMLRGLRERVVGAPAKGRDCGA